MERLDADSGIFSTSSRVMDDGSLTSPTLSVNSIDAFPTIVINPESPTCRINAISEMVNDLRLRSQWEQTVQLYGGAFASSGEVTPRSVTPPARPDALDTKSNLKRSVSARSSLKTSGVKSPRRKKMVRFADSMGLDLEHIKHILIDDYTVPDSPDPRPLNSSVIIRAPRKISASTSSSSGRFLIQRFSLPFGYSIPKLVDARKVCLESLTILDLSVTGVVRVANLAFEKQVHVRYTLDGWATWTEVRASFISSASNGEHDLFSFSLFLPYDLPNGSRCEFCVRYSVAGREHWDNNDKANYVLDYCAPQSPAPYQSSGWSHFLY